MNLEDYKVKWLTKMLSEQELVTLYNDCSNFDIFQKRDINEPKKEMYSKLFASGNHVIINDILDLKSFISSRTVEFILINPNLARKVFKFKYSHNIKYQVTSLLCKALNYKRYQSDNTFFYNRKQIYLNYSKELYRLIKEEKDPNNSLKRIKYIISYYFCRRTTFIEHNFLKFVKISDDMQLEISSVCKGIIIIKINNTNRLLTLFIEKSVIGIHNYLYIIDKVNKTLSGR